ncbi:MAG: helix-turn-helix domain-containing protein [Myxococcota bacterium]
MDARTIRMLRFQLGWTQKELGDYLGVSQPLVSSWESGRRVPEGPALQAIERLASTKPSTSPPDRSLLLGAALRLLEDTPAVNENDEEVDAPALLAAYRSRMADQIDELEALQREKGASSPRLRAYLDQGEFPPESSLGTAAHRAAMKAFLFGDPRSVAETNAWYGDQLRRALADAPEHRRAEAEVVLLAIDALWLFDLLGLRHPSSRDALVQTARRMLDVNDESTSR